MLNKAAKDVLVELVNNTEFTGGLIKLTDGNFAPVAEPQWLDLGHTIKKAKDVLDSYNIPAPLTIEESHHSSLEAVLVDDKFS